MVKSMTGFGIGEAGSPAGRLVLEVRAVNHRYLDIRVRGPRELADLAVYAEQLGRERLSRGRVEVAIRIEGPTSQLVFLDGERARSAYQALCQLRDDLAPGSDVPLSMLTAVPDLFAPALERERESMRESCRDAFDRALHALELMRVEEGHALAADLRGRLNTVRRVVEAIAIRVPSLVEAYQRKLRGRLSRLLPEGVPLDLVRLEQEVAMLADRCDVSEELTRLASHCSQFEMLIDGREACGRRLDFLLQEMVREVNTLGSKAQDADVAHLVVETKSELERMREQVQNVE